MFQPGPRPLAEIKDEALVVVDTNALLLPYTINSENLVEIKNTYGHLVQEDRLFLPAQVAREFAKNRALKLGELYHNLDQKRGLENKFSPGIYPLLDELPAYQEVLRVAKEIDDKRKELQKALALVVGHVGDWSWNDPVSSAYMNIFTAANIVEASISEDDFIVDCTHRQKHNIPPGFKDDSNGDLLIWHTILELGAAKKKDLIFVSGDEKTDWRHQSNGKALYPRYELVDEYRRVSEGKSFHIIRLSALLELYGVKVETVQKVRSEEAKDSLTVVQSFQRSPAKVLLAFTLVKWIREQYPFLHIYQNKGFFPDIIVTDPSGRPIGVEVRLLKENQPSTAFYSGVQSAYSQGVDAVSENRLSRCIICIICPLQLPVMQITSHIKRSMPTLGDAELWIGYIDNQGQFQPIETTDLVNP